MHQSIQPVAEVRSRAARYQDVDGIPYLFSGLTLVFWGVWFVLPSEIPSLGTFGRILLRVAFVAPFWMLFFQNKLTEWAKTRITYQRTGFVAHDYQIRTIGLAEILAILPVVLLFGGMPFFSGSAARFFFRWVLPISMLMAATGVLMRRKALASEFILVLGSLLLGFVCWVIFSPAKPFGTLFIIFGVGLALTGLIRLLLYLTQNPKAQA